MGNIGAESGEEDGITTMISTYVMMLNVGVLIAAMVDIVSGADHIVDG